MIQKNDGDAQQTPEQVSPQAAPNQPIESVKKDVLGSLWKPDREHIAIIVLFTGIPCLMLAFLAWFIYPAFDMPSANLVTDPFSFVTDPFSFVWVSAPFALLGIGVGLYYRKAIPLCVITALWWVVSFFSADVIWQTWGHREGELYALGVGIITLPYVLFFTPMVGMELFFIRKWRGLDATLLKWEAGLLEAWLIVQAILAIDVIMFQN